MVEFEEKDDLKHDTNGVFEGRKCFLGVTKNKNRWLARIRHPKLKFEVSLGSYGTPEEAALVVKKKKAEFEEMFKGENNMNMETCRDDFEGKKLPRGVSRRGYRRWGAQIWHPKLKRHFRLGSYSTPEEAAFVVDKKRAEFLKMNGWIPKVKPDCKESKENGFSLEKLKHEILDDLSGDLKVPSGVTKVKSGKWGARIRDPESRDRFWLGTFDTAKEAIKSLNKAKAEHAAERKMYGLSPKVKSDCRESKYNEFSLEKPKHDILDDLSCDPKGPSSVTKIKSWKWGARIRDPRSRARFRPGTFDSAKEAVTFLNKAKAELAAKRKRAEFDGPSFVANESAMKIERADDLNIASIPDKLESKFAQCSPISIDEPEKSNNADVGDKSAIRKGNEQKSGCVFDFEEAMSLGFINEYGQLVGEYSDLDEQMWLSVHDEDVADLGYYCRSL